MSIWGLLRGSETDHLRRQLCVAFDRLAWDLLPEDLLVPEFQPQVPGIGFEFGTIARPNRSKLGKFTARCQRDESEMRRRFRAAAGIQAQLLRQIYPHWSASVAGLVMRGAMASWIRLVAREYFLEAPWVMKASVLLVLKGDDRVYLQGPVGLIAVVQDREMESVHGRAGKPNGGPGT